MSSSELTGGGLAVTGMRKRYGSTEVLKSVDLAVKSGTVHALLGPNGAGKSTLIKCVCGSVDWDAGSVLLNGHALSNLTPASARAAGIVTIHQHLSLVGSLSITDNLFLGRELRVGPWTRRGAERAEATALLERFGLDVSPDLLVSRLGAGRKQLVEIAKAWVGGNDVKVLILDEPTASLSSEESEILFGEIARVAGEGVSVIYVTHRLGEVFRVADDVTVLRNGEVELSGSTLTIKPEQVVAALSGTEVAPVRQAASTMLSNGLEITDLQGPRFGPVSLKAAAGEVVGLFGPLGAGRTALLETLIGRYHSTGGSVAVNGRPHSPRNPRASRDAGVVLVPADRATEGIWLNQSTSFNAVLPRYGKLAGGPLRSLGAELAAYQQLASSLEVTPPDPDVPIANLSGGNAQKVMIGRWLSATDELNVLLVDEPTNGVDVRARGHIHAALRAAADDGLAVLMSSSDADELALYADRVLVFDNGVIIAELIGDEITPQGLLAAAHQLATVHGSVLTQTRNMP